MNPEFLTGNPVDYRNVRSGNHLLIFIICLTISAFIWFLIVISKESNTVIEYPLVFDNVPENLVMVDQTDTVISFSISKGSVSLITLKYLVRKSPVRIDLSNVVLIKDAKHFIATISARDISGKLIDRLNLNDDDVTFSPETITLRFESLTGVKVKVKPSLILEFEQQFQLSQEIQVVPDSITLLGPYEIISRLEYVETSPKEIKNISRSQTVNVPLALPENLKDVKCVPDKVNVILSVDKFTESEIEIPIIYGNPDVSIRTYPDKLKVIYYVSLDNFRRVDKDMFIASVTYLGEQPGTKLKVDLKQYPSFVRIIRIEPEEVEYLLLK